MFVAICFLLAYLFEVSMNCHVSFYKDKSLFNAVFLCTTNLNENKWQSLFMRSVGATCTHCSSHFGTCSNSNINFLIASA